MIEIDLIAYRVAITPTIASTTAVRASAKVEYCLLFVRVTKCGFTRRKAKFSGTKLKDTGCRAATISWNQPQKNGNQHLRSSSSGKHALCFDDSSAHGFLRVTAQRTKRMDKEWQWNFYKARCNLVLVKGLFSHIEHTNVQVTARKNPTIQLDFHVKTTDLATQTAMSLETQVS